MTAVAHEGSARRIPAPSFHEFVLIIAVTMGLMSLSIDNLLPAFGPIQASFGIVDPNEMQLIITLYMLGFAVMQLVYGPVSDAIGRRLTMMLGLVIFVAGVLIGMVADSYAMLLVGRVVQGAGASAARVLTIAIVRDRFAGREMARVMSLTFVIFIIVPIIAPALGGLFLAMGSWRWIFSSMLALALVVGIWFWTRMPETLHPEYRHPVSARRIADAMALTLGTRASFGYSTAMAVMQGTLMGYLGCAQQIFETTIYGLGALFPVAFGLVAATMGFASFLNGRLVRRFGMRRLCHLGMMGFTAASLILLAAALAFDGRPPLLVFGVLFAAAQFMFSLTMPNFNALAMEPLGSIAGTASSAIGAYTTLVGAVLGMAMGQAFDGTVTPLAIGFFICGVGTVAVVFWTERGRLFAGRGDRGDGDLGEMMADAGH